jgi:hypothetical protein
MNGYTIDGMHSFELLKKFLLYDKSSLKAPISSL